MLTVPEIAELIAFVCSTILKIQYFEGFTAPFS